MKSDKLPLPFLKWAGGKRQLLTAIVSYLPKKTKLYYEPFVGAGALLFHMQPQRACINDSNSELMNCYTTIRDYPRELIAALRLHENKAEYYYAIRDQDRSGAYQDMSPVERAARIMYLNKTCYNGLFRVNSQEQFNVPFGRYKNPNIVNEAGIMAVHRYLTGNQVTITCQDFAGAVQAAKQGDFIYFDPPYDPVSDTAGFTGYCAGGFGRAEQERLAQVFADCAGRGCWVMLSNSHTAFIRELYKGYRIIPVQAARSINSNADKRGAIEEVLVMNA